MPRTAIAMVHAFAHRYQQALFRVEKETDRAPNKRIKMFTGIYNHKIL